MVETLRAIGPYSAAVVALVAAAMTYFNARSANQIKKVEVLDEKQEQIVEWGFRAADEANKRADRIAEEARVQLANLQEQLDMLDRKLREQTKAMVDVREAHATELRLLRESHQREVDERNRRIYALEDAAKANRDDLRYRTSEE